MTTRLLIPFRGTRDSKTRLADVFSADERAVLVRSMLVRLIEAAGASGVVDDIVVTTRNPGAVSMPTASLDIRIEPQPDDQPGLNRALTYGRDQALRDGIDHLMIAPADLPLVTPDDLRLLHSHPSGVGIVPDIRQSGTNGFLLPLAMHTQQCADFRFQMGAASLYRHLNETERLGLSVAVRPCHGMMRDLDTPADWLALPHDEQRALTAEMKGMECLKG